jgi:acyl-CoA thioester hydrolase
VTTRRRAPARPDARDLEGDFPHAVVVPVRVADTDTFDHVNNATYLTYFEIGRVEYLVAATGRRLPVPSFGDRRSYILGEARVTFRSPATVGELLTVETRVSQIGRSSLTMEHRITAPIDGTEDARVVAVGETLLIRYDYDLAAPVPFEDELVTAFERFEGVRLRAAPR